MTFKANEGYRVTAITVDGEALTGEALDAAVAAGKVVVDRTRDHSVAVTASKEGEPVPQTHTLTTQATNATILAGYTFNHDEQATIDVTFMANSGYHITSVTVDGEALTDEALDAAIAAGKVVVDCASDHSVVVAAVQNDNGSDNDDDDDDDRNEGNNNGGGSNLPDDPTPLNPTPGGDNNAVDLPDDQTPLNPAPDVDATDDGVEILDENTPLGNLPQTGTMAQPADPVWTAGLLAVMVSLAAAGLAVSLGRKKEEE